MSNVPFDMVSLTPMKNHTPSANPSSPPSDPDAIHPLQIALRTYALALSLAVGPALIPLVTNLLSSRNSRRGSTSNALYRILRRELAPDGFAFAITLSVAGGAGLKKILDWCSESHARNVQQKPLSEKTPKSSNALLAELQALTRRIHAILSHLNSEQRTFVCSLVSSCVGVSLIQAGRQRIKSSFVSANQAQATSSTIDLTLLLLVRALDSVVQAFVIQHSIGSSLPNIIVTSPSKTDATSLDSVNLIRTKLEKERQRQETKARQKLTSQIDGFVFWACSARIMWCFFYEPTRLPRSYVKWINTLANLDGRILKTLHYIRDGSWSYRNGSPHHSHLLQASARELGYPSSWGDPRALPAYGGKVADEAWRKLGSSNRPGVGGLPCEVLHGRVGSSLGLTQSCTANATLRLLKGFVDALAIYLPVHFLPVLLTRPQTLLQPRRLFEATVGAVRSATFLSSFISLYWYAVCLTRTLVLAKMFPSISHDFWDGPYGCVLAGCLTCGGSIWIENGRRRGEMALYVLPRAIRAILPLRWLKGGWRIKLAERLVFVLSLATLLTAASHRPESLRGLSRWTLSFIINGPNTGFWKRKRRSEDSIPPTPSTVPITPAVPHEATNGGN